MKLTIALMLICILTVNANSYSQETKLNLSFVDKSIVDVLREIENQSEFYFFFNEDELKNFKAVAVNVKNAKVEDVLAQILSETGVTYRIIDRYILVNKSNKIDEQQPSQQYKTVTGKVTDGNGVPLPGVTVVVENTTHGTVTDNDGNYSLPNVIYNATLVFSFVGMKTLEIPVIEKTTINVVMEQEAIGIEEVVAVGYGTMKKSDLTGSVSSVSKEDLDNLPIISLDEGLQGRASGVQITQASGAPGAGLSILVRGGNSILGGNQPLYVIDGFPVYNDNNTFKGTDPGPRQSSNTGTIPLNVLSTLNPSDIESIEILKDASATSIYGSRGANGVVLITTKQGKKRSAQIDFQGYYGVQSLAGDMNFLNARQYGEWLNLRAEVAREAGDQTVDLLSDDQLKTFEDFNYMNAMLRKTSILQDYTLSVTGGGENSTYAISAGFLDQEGIIRKSNFERYSLRSNVTADISNKILAGMSLSLARINSEYAPTEGGSEMSSNLLLQVAQWPSIIPPYDENGEYLTGEKIREEKYMPEGVNTLFTAPLNDSPLLILNETDDNQILDKALSNLFVSYDILEGLRLRINFGADITKSDREYYWSRLSQYGQVNEISGGRAVIQNVNKTSYLNENTLSYIKTFDIVHSINAVIGFTNQSEVFKTRYMENTGFVTDITKTNDIGGGNQIPGVSSLKTSWSMASWLGRFNYIYSDKYLVTLTARADGSSKFSEGHKWGYFPAVALGWRASRESFIQNIDFISNLKLRASWGITGNQEIGAASALATFSSRSYSMNGNPVVGLEPNGVNNPDLIWEKTTQADIGLDFGILNNRIQLTADYYQKNTEDLLLYFPLPLERGISSITKNAGALTNKGIEMQIDADIMRGIVDWETSFNISTNRNKVIDLQGIEMINPGRLSGQYHQNLMVVMEGHPVGVFYGLRTDGILESQEDIANHTTTLEDGTVAILQEKALVGAPRVLDLNEDGKIDLDDRTVLGDPFPDFIYGWSNKFAYKNFDLSFFMQGVQGIEIYNLLAQYTAERRLTGVWPHGKYPRPDAVQNSIPSQPIKDYEIEDGSYIRMSYLTLGYNMPVKKVTGLRSLRLYVTAKNLFTITKYSGYSPDVNSTISSSYLRGIDTGAYPTSRSFIVGVNIGL